MIQAVQVGEVTGLVPPGSLVQCGTVAGIGVVVSIFSAECHAAMVRKRVTSSPYKQISKRKTITLEYFIIIPYNRVL